MSEPIADEATSVQVVRDVDDLPAGNYLLEIDVDDGWTKPTLPRSGPTNVLAVPLGTSDERRERIEQLRSGNGLGVLERAISTGHIARQLTAQELEDVAPAALVALRLFDIRPDPGLQHPAGLREATSLLCADVRAMTAAIIDAAETSRFDRVDAARLAVRLARRIDPAPLGVIGDGDLRRLWSTAPGVAVMVDAVPDPSPERCERMEEALGWSPRANIEDIATGEPIKQNMAGLDGDTLRAIRVGMDLLPKALLDLDTYATAQFEWLIPNSEDEFAAQEFLRRYRLPPTEAGGPARTHLEHRIAPHGTEKWASLPHYSLSAALGLMADDDPHGEEDLLFELATIAPRLVERDLVLARLLDLYGETTTAPETP